MNRRGAILLLAIFLAWIPFRQGIAATTVSSNITSSKTWTVSGSPYIVTAAIKVRGANHGQTAGLTIQAGVEVRFRSGARITVGDSSGSAVYYGWVKAIGTTDTPIVFTSDEETPAAGNWTGVVFTNHNVDSESNLQYCRFEYGGASTSSLVRLESANATIKNNIFQHSSAWGIYADGSSTSSTIHDNTFLSNASGAINIAPNALGGLQRNTGEGKIRLRGGNLTKSATLHNQDLPFEVTGNITIRGASHGNTGALTVEPGTEIRFNQDIQLIVGASEGSASYYGWINATGTAENPVLFTANTSEPVAGYWKGIYFHDKTTDASSVLSNVVIQYAGSSGSGSAAIYLSSANPSITNSLIEYSAAYGINASSGALDATINGNTFQNNAWNPICIYPNAINKVRNNTGEGRIKIVGANFTRTATLYKQDLAFAIAGDITIRGASHGNTAGMTIQPGTEIRFNQDVRLYIAASEGSASYYGWLNATGTAENPIVFTANSSEPTPGFWKGLYFRNQTTDASTVFDHVVIEYGQPNLYVSSASFPIKNSEFRYSGTHGIQLADSAGVTIGSSDNGNRIYQNTSYGIYQANSSGVPTVRYNEIYENHVAMRLGRNFNSYSNTIHDNTYDIIETWGGQLDRSITWRDENAPIVVLNDITVRGTNHGDTVGLTINAGTEVHFNQDKRLIIGASEGSASYYGWINATGTAENPIVFSANATDPAQGFWGGIYFHDKTNDGNSILSHTEIRYGGQNVSGRNAAVYTASANPTISNSLIEYSAVYGIYADGSSTNTTISNNTFQNNGGSPVCIAPNGLGYVTGNSGQGRIKLRGGSFTRTATLHNQDMAFKVSADITVRGGSHGQTAGLTIQPGTEIYFYQDIRLYVGYSEGSAIYYGWVNASGTEDSPVLFSANTSAPTPGFWKGLYFRDQTVDASTVLDHVVVEYGQPNIYATNASFTVTNSHIRYSGTHGIQLADSSWVKIGNSGSGNKIYRNSSYGIYQANSSGVPTVRYNEIYENASVAVRLGRNFNSYSNLIHDNGYDIIQTWGGQLDRSITWRDEDVPIVVLNSITVRGANHNDIVGLTVNPGVEVRFSQNMQLIVGAVSGSAQFYGWIKANGTEENPIVFTSNQGTHSAGYWKGIYFHTNTKDADTILDHVIVEYGGNTSNANIYAASAAPTIQNSTIRNSSYYGIYLDGGSNSTKIKNCNFTDNAVAPVSALANAVNYMSDNAGEGRITIRGSNFTHTNGRWRRQGLGYNVSGNVSVRGGSHGATGKLTIDPGTDIRFYAGTRMYIGGSEGSAQYYGVLWAQGLAGLPILFSSATDLPAPGDWNGLYFHTNTVDASTTMEHCIVEYAGTNVYVNNAKFPFKYNTMQYASGNGMTLYGGGCDGMRLECNNFKGNNNGVSIQSGSDPRMVNNNFLGNIQYGITNTGSSSAINAVNNWWGDPTGPSGGDAVNGSVLYEPVLEEPSDCVSLPPDNFAPYTPMHPTPSDGALNVALDESGGLLLQWRGGDPDPLDEIFYDVYFSKDSENLELIGTDLTESSLMMNDLEIGMRYYWKVVAKDGAGNVTEGAVWHFVTAGPPSDLALGTLEIEVPEGGLVSGMATTVRVTVTNIGEGPVSVAFPTTLKIDDTTYETQWIDRVLITDEAETLSFTWIAQAGTHTGEFIVDLDNLVEESDETNNTLAFELPEIPYPDLIPQDIVLQTENPVQGETSTVAVVLQNLGADTLKDVLIELKSSNLTYSAWWNGGLPSGEATEIPFEIPTPAGEFSASATVDASNLVAESDEENNVFEKILATIPYPDLTGVEYEVEPLVPYINENVLVTLEIANEGEGGTVLPFNVSLMVDGTKVDAARVLEELRTPENSAFVELNWTAQPGVHNLELRIDSKSEVAESDEVDNIIPVGELEILLPDYIPTLADYRPEEISQGESVYFTATVENQGEGANVLPVQVRFHIDEIAFNTTEMLTWLEPGAMGQITNDAAWRAQAGEHCYQITVNPDGNMPEENLENNTISGCLPLVEQPDLTLLSINYDSDALDLGNVVSFSTTVTNIGTGDTWLPFKVALYANGVRQSGAKTVEILEVGQEQGVTLPWRVAAGDWTIELRADADNQVEESDETNNTIETVLPHIFGPPDISVALVDYEGEKVWGERVVSWNASHSEDVAISRVRVYANHSGDHLLIDTTEAQGTVPWDTTQFPDGTYRLRGLVTDANGVQDEAVSGSFEVRNQRSIALSSSPSSWQTGRIQEELFFTIKIDNLQPEQDTFSLSLTNTDNLFDLTIEDNSLSVPAWGSASTTVHATSDATGTYHFKVGAVSDTNPALNAEVSLSVRITEPFLFSLSPENVQTSLGDSLTYTISVTNQLTIADTYSFVVSGFPEGWIVAPGSVTLNPGETALRSMSVEEIDQIGNFELAVETTSEQTGAMKRRTSTLTTQADPKITWLWPENGYRSGSDSILIQWETNVPTSGTLLLREKNADEWTPYQAQEGLFHGSWVEGLLRNTEYEFYVENVNEYGDVESSIRSFSVTNGVVFTENSHSFSLYRGKSKEFSISVQNTDSVPHQIVASIIDPPDDLNVGIVGPGSGSDEGEVLIVPAGNVASLTLAVHAQESESNDYAFSVGLQTVDEEAPIYDQTRVAVQLLDMAVEFSVTYLSENATTLAKRYRITNKGAAIYDLNVSLDEYLREDSTVVPLIDHATLEENGTLEFEVVPEITPDFTGIGGTMTVTGGGYTVRKTLDFSLPTSYDTFSYRLAEAECAFSPLESSWTTLDFDNRYHSFTWSFGDKGPTSWLIDDRGEELYTPTAEEVAAGVNVFDVSIAAETEESEISFAFEGLVPNPYVEDGENIPMVRRRIEWSGSVEDVMVSESVTEAFTTPQAFEISLEYRDAIAAAEKTQQERILLTWAAKTASELATIIDSVEEQDPLLTYAEGTLKDWIEDNTDTGSFMGLFEKISTGANSYTTNHQRVESTVATPSGLAAEDLTAAYLGFHFSPQSHLTPHDVDIFFNDWLVGNFRQDTPRGYFFYGLEAYQVFFGTGATNQVAITLYNNKPGETSILYDFTLLFTLLDMELTYAATDEAAAYQKLCNTYGNLLRRADLAVYETSIVTSETSALVDREETIDLTVFNRGSVGGIALATLTVGEETVWEDFVYVPGLGRTDFPIHWLPETPGGHNISFTLKIFEPDRDYSNHQVATTLSVVEQLSYPLTVAVTPPRSGTIQGEGIACPDDCSETLSDGATLDLLAIPNAGYEFITWKGDATTTETTLPVTMNGAKSYIAEFSCIELAQPVLESDAEGVYNEVPYALSWDSIEEATGYVLQESLDTDFSTFEEIQTEELTQDYEKFVETTTTYSYRLKAVSGCGESAWSEPISVTVSDHHLYSLTVSANGHGSVSGEGIACPNECQEDVEETLPVTLEATPEYAYAFDHWVVSGEPEPLEENPLEFDMAGDTQVEAFFECFQPAPTVAQASASEVEWLVPYTISWNEVEYAKTYTIEESLTSDFSEPVQIETSEPQQDYQHAVDVDTTYYYRIATQTLCTTSEYSNIVQVTVLAREEYTVSITLDGQGTVSGSGIDCPGTCEAVFYEEAPVALTASPSEGWRFVRWDGDLPQTQAEWSIESIGQNYNLTAVFEMIEPAIFVEPMALDFGEVSVAGAGEYDEITITNTGGADLIVSRVERTSVTPTSLLIMQETCTSRALARNETCKLQVRFAPQREGSAEGGVRIYSNDPSQSVLTVSLSGQGVSESLPLRVVLFQADPEEGTPPLTVDLSWVIVGGSAPYACEILVNGEREYQFDDCQAESGQEHEFLEEGTYSVQLLVTDSDQTDAGAALEVHVFIEEEEEGEGDQDVDLPPGDLDEEEISEEDFDITEIDEDAVTESDDDASAEEDLEEWEAEEPESGLEFEQEGEDDRIEDESENDVIDTSELEIDDELADAENIDRSTDEKTGAVGGDSGMCRGVGVHSSWWWFLCAALLLVIRRRSFLA